MSEKVCKCCGQTLPLPFEIGIALSKRSRELLDAVYLAGEHGISTERLIARMYDDDPNGGPEDARKTIHVRICQINKKLRQRGWSMDARGDHQGFYVLQKMSLSPGEAVGVVRMALGYA